MSEIPDAVLALFTNPNIQGPLMRTTPEAFLERVVSQAQVRYPRHSGGIGFNIPLWAVLAVDKPDVVIGAFAPGDMTEYRMSFVFSRWNDDWPEQIVTTCENITRRGFVLVTGAEPTASDVRWVVGEDEINEYTAHMFAALIAVATLAVTDTLDWR